MMRGGLYHMDLALPEGYRHPRALVAVEYSAHARQASRNDRYGFIPLPDVLSLSRFHTVEVEVTEGRVSKIVVRGDILNDLTEGRSDRDVIYVLIPKAGQAWFCKTVWANLKSDKHKTLDRSRYVV